MSNRAGTFKFFKTWTLHEDCRRLLLENWTNRFRGHVMSRLQVKLKHMKKIYTHWNRTVFGDVDKQVRLAVDEVNRIQQIIDTDGFSNQLYTQDIEAQLLLTKALNHQEEFWREKARDQQFIHGDRNTAYFHRVAKVRASKNSISFLQDGERVITDPSDIEVHMVNYFKSIFTVANNCNHNNLIEETIPSMVSDDENQQLMRVAQRDEIKDAVFALNGDGGPGPDGFGGHFYQTYWDIVGTDVVQSVQEFFYY